MRGIPRWAMSIVWAVYLPIVYCALPYYISLYSRRYGWRVAYPTSANYLGLLGVIVGLSIAGWVVREHYRNIPTEGAPIGSPLHGPGYVLTKGLYGYCRHPTHIGTLLIWFGWALFYGNVGVLLGATVISFAVVVIVPKEERGMELQLGEAYRQYMAEVPRWGFGKGQAPR